MDALIKFRVATEDKVRFEKCAERGGKSLSDWVRLACFRMAEAADEADAEIAFQEVKLAKLHKAMTDPIQQARVVARINPEKILDFQRKVGMAGGKKRG